MIIFIHANIEEVGQLFGAVSSVMCTPIICNT